MRFLGSFIHDERGASPTVSSLGYVIDGHAEIVKPKPHKLRFILETCRFLFSGFRINVRESQRFLGHLVLVFLLNRPLLSIMRSLYDFVQWVGDRRAHLWKSCLKEIGWIMVLLPFARCQLDLPWSTQLTISDACVTGVALCSLDVNVGDARSIGEIAERSRFKCSPPSWNARTRALSQLDPFHRRRHRGACNSTTNSFAYLLDEGFTEVLTRLSCHPDWSSRFNMRVTHASKIVCLEGKGVFLAARDKLRASTHFCVRHVHLGDNLGNELMIEKGRGVSLSLFLMCRRLCVLTAASGCCFHHRWVPSEHNAADSPSRWWGKCYQGTQTAKPSGSGNGSVSAQPLCHDQAGPTKQNIEGDSKRNWPDMPGVGGCNYSSVPPQKDHALPVTLQHVLAAANEQHRMRGGSRALRRFPLIRRSITLGTSGHSYGFRGQVPRVFPSWVSDTTKGEKEFAEFLEKHAADQAATRELQLEHANRHRFAHPTWTHLCSGADADVCTLFPARRVAQGSNQGRHTQGAGKRPCRKHNVSRSNGGSVQDQPRQSKPPARQTRCGLAVRGIVVFCARAFGHKGAKRFNAQALGVHASADKVEGVSGAAEAKDPIHPVSNSSHSAVYGPQAKAQTVPRIKFAPSQSRSHFAAGGGKREARHPKDNAYDARVPRKAYVDLQGAKMSAAYGPASRKAESFQLCRSGCPRPVHVARSKKANHWKDSRCAAFTVWGILSVSQHWSNVGARHGVAVDVFDILDNERNDFFDPKGIRWFAKELKLKRHSLVLFALPCHWWSRARRPGFGPGPLRDDGQLLWGYPDLSGVDKKKVEVGNTLWRNTFAMIVECKKLSVAWILENPNSSRIFKPHLYRKLLRVGALAHVAPFCHCGIEWKKDMRFVTSQSLASRQEFRRCIPKHHLCSRIGCRHKQLIGVDPDTKLFWTAMAQPYPPPLPFALQSHMEINYYGFCYSCMIQIFIRWLTATFILMAYGVSGCRNGIFQLSMQSSGGLIGFSNPYCCFHQILYVAKNLSACMNHGCACTGMGNARNVFFGRLWIIGHGLFPRGWALTVIAQCLQTIATASACVDPASLLWCPGLRGLRCQPSALRSTDGSR